MVALKQRHCASVAHIILTSVIMNRFGILLFCYRFISSFGIEEMSVF